MKRIWIFIGITFLLSWGIEFILDSFDFLGSSSAQVWVIFIMMIPAVGHLITKMSTKDGDSALYLRPKVKGRELAKSIACAWLIPVAAIAVGAALYFITHLSVFDGKMIYYTTAYQEMCAEQGVDYSLAQIRQAVYGQIAAGIIFYPLLNLMPAFGCEFGFRAYLMPRFAEQYNVPTAVMLSGIIWGLWYAPLVSMGQFYGTGYTGYPYLGMMAAILLCVVLGIFLSWLMLESGSCVISALALSCFNSLSSVSVYFCSSDSYSPFVGPVATGIIGGIGFVLIAVWVMKEKLLKKKYI